MKIREMINNMKNTRRALARQKEKNRKKAEKEERKQRNMDRAISFADFVTQTIACTLTSIFIGHIATNKDTIIAIIWYFLVFVLLFYNFMSHIYQSFKVDENFSWVRAIYLAIGGNAFYISSAIAAIASAYILNRADRSFISTCVIYFAYLLIYYCIIAISFGAGWLSDYIKDHTNFLIKIKKWREEIILLICALICTAMLFIVVMGIIFWFS